MAVTVTLTSNEIKRDVRVQMNTTALDANTVGGTCLKRLTVLSIRSSQPTEILFAEKSMHEQSQVCNNEIWFAMCLPERHIRCLM
jgi:hypothetical protein